MRDADKIREKIELNLDSRQVVSLVIGSLVVLGVVFVLGVMVGKQLAPQGQSAPQDLLATLDKASDAGAVPLTFQQELTKPVAPTVVAEARVKPPERPTPKVDAHPAPAEPKVEAPRPLQPKADLSAEPKPEPKVEAKPEPKPVEKPVEAKVDPRPQPKPEAAAEDAPPPSMDKKLADAFTAAKHASASKPPPAVAVAPPSPAGAFTVQVAASQQKDEADAVVQKLRGSGLRPYLVDVDIPGKGHWYRVRLGSFKSRDDAQKYVQDLKRETGLSAFVTAAR